MKYGTPFYIGLLIAFGLSGCSDSGVVVAQSTGAQTNTINASEVSSSTESGETLTTEQSGSPTEPELTAEPELTIVPQVTAAPEQVLEPQVTAAPEQILDPEVTAFPEQTPVPEVSAEPLTIESPSNLIESNAPAVVIPGTTVFTPTDSDITDSRGFFDLDGYDSQNVIRIDVRTVTNEGICTVDDQSGCTLSDVLNDIDGSDDFKVEIPVHVSSNDFVDDGSVSNAELRQRGATSRTAVQKSFRIKLDSKEVLWRNERRMQLNKHPFERSRFRNKLSFDLMRELPHLPSLRTQFVNLWIDDGSGPVDQGLYTHIEAPVKEYLVNRGWDEDDNLYKADRFFFSASDLREMQLDENGEPIDLDRFEARLEIKRGDSHEPLINMLSALNDPSQSFNSVFDRYFNTNNVLMWMATNFVLGQKDVSSHNYYLYNPKGTEKFYFLPWDYDGAMTPELELSDSLSNESLRTRLSFGYARFKDNVFVSGYLREPGAHQRIIAAANELRNVYLTDDIVSYRVQQYAQLVRPYVSRSPDIENLAGVRELSFMNVYDDSVNAMPAFIESNIQSLRNDFGLPLPSFLKQPLIRVNQVVLQWEPAFSMTSGSLYYDVQVSSSPLFEADNVVATVNNVGDRSVLVQQSIDRDLLTEGVWYFRVFTRDESDPDRLWNIAKNELQVDGQTVFGVRAFSVP